jgi:hypothetical protein
MPKTHCKSASEEATEGLFLSQDRYLSSPCPSAGGWHIDRLITYPFVFPCLDALHPACRDSWYQALRLRGVEQTDDGS